MCYLIVLLIWMLLVQVDETLLGSSVRGFDGEVSMSEV